MIMIRRKTWNILIISIPYIISTLVFISMLTGNNTKVLSYSLWIGLIITQIVALIAIINELETTIKIDLESYLIFLIFLTPIINVGVVGATSIVGLIYLMIKGIAKIEKNNIIDENEES